MLTKAWKKVIDAYNVGAKKLRKPPMEFDLPAYVVDETYKRLAGLISDKEEAIHHGGDIPAGCPYEDEVTKCYGALSEQKW